MDRNEKIAKKYLESLDIGVVIYEPDGNIPPDFTIKGEIAIEVRKLNQNWVVNEEKYEGLEEIEIPLWHCLDKLLQSLGPSINGESWFVFIDFRRPIEPWRVLKKKVKKRLQEFISSQTKSECQLKISNSLTIELLKASKDHGVSFLVGGGSDDDSGGSVFGELERNIKICINEKQKKTENYREKYKEWWLVLVDYIDRSVEKDGREIFTRDIASRITHNFNKVVILDPREIREAYEI